MNSSNPVHKLILGTVQFGLSYGINNSSGQVSSTNVEKILHECKQRGIALLDTAEGYGTSQEQIGPHSTPFQVMSKFHVAKLNGELEKNLDATLQTLKKESLFCYSFHSFADAKNRDVIHQLIDLKRRRKIQKIGVSLYTNEQLIEAISWDWVDIIQLPFNLLDNLGKRGTLLAEAQSMGKMVHVRSVFLQGLFFRKLDSLPKKLRPLRPYLQKVRDLCSKYQISQETACLLYPLSLPQIDGVLFGVDNLAHLQSNLDAIKRPLPAQFVNEISEIFVEEDDLLQPQNW